MQAGSPIKMSTVSFNNCPLLFHSSLTVKHRKSDFVQVQYTTKHSLPTNFKEPSYLVDNSGLERADNAAVVEDWMFFIQFFEGCSCLGGEEKHVVIVGQSTVKSCVCVCEA